MSHQVSPVGKLLRGIGYLLASVLLFLAVTITAVRIMLPHVEGYRESISDLISKQLGLPLTMEGIDARLLGYSPEIRLIGVQLLDRNKAPIISLDEVRLNIDIVRSYQGGALVLDELEIFGAELELVREVDGTLSLHGIAADGEATSDTGLSAGLLAHRQIHLHNSTLIWNDLLQGVRYRFDAPSVVMSNDFSSDRPRHRLSASLTLPDTWGESLELALDLSGDVLNPKDWVGEMYLQAHSVQPAALLGAVETVPLKVDGGRVDIELWLSGRHGHIDELQGRVAGHALNLVHDEQSLLIDEIGSGIRWRQQASGWQLQLDDFEMSRQGRRWEPADLSLQVNDGDMQLEAGFLRLDDLAALATVIPHGQQDINQWLERLAPIGDLRRLRLTQHSSGVAGQANVENLGWQRWQDIPGVAGLDGDITFVDQDVRATLLGHNMKLDFGELFRSPLLLSQFSGGVALQRQDDDSWILQGRDIRFANDDLRGIGDLDMHVPTQGSTYMDLGVGFYQGNPASTSAYLPVSIMGTETVAWLDRAFQHGRLTEGKMRLRGTLDAFPYRDHRGQFEVCFDVSELGLHYQDDWPPLTGIKGTARFDGPGMHIVGHAGQILGSPIESVAVAIPDFAHPRLVVNGRVAARTDDVLTILRDTPLAERVGDSLDSMSADGEGALTIALGIPLSEEDTKPVSVSGALTLRDSRLSVASNVTFDQVNGTVRFDDTRITADGLQAVLFERPVHIDITTPKRRPVTTHVSFAGSLESSAMQRALVVPSLTRMAGETEWHGSLSIPHHAGDTVLTVQSDLTGMATDLPNPFDKKADERKPVAWRWYLSGERANELELEVAPRFQGIIQFNPDRSLKKAALHFGTRMPELPPIDEIRVSGSLLRVSPGEWRDLFGADGEGGNLYPINFNMYRMQLLTDSGGESVSDYQALPYIAVNVERFEVDDVRVGSVALRIVPETDRNVLESFVIQGKHFRVDGNGAWHRQGSAGETRLDLKLKSKDMGKMMQELKFVSVIGDGSLKANGQFHWQGGPSDFALGRLNGELKMSVSDGHISDVKPGAGGRLLGLFSLQALPRRLSLDFSDVLSKGLAFESIEGDMRISNGDVFTDNLYSRSSSATILMTGRTGLATKDYDLRVVAVPNVSDSLSVAGGLTMGPQVGFFLWAVQKLFKTDEANAIEYTVTGSWQDPEIERIRKEQPADTGDLLRQ